MKTLFATLVISITAALCLAQSDEQKEPNWQPFAPDKEEFATEVPTALTPKIGVRGLSRSYRGKLNNTWFFIFSDVISGPSSTKIALNFARNSQPVGTLENFGDMPSEKFEFGDDDGFYHRLFTFKTNTRIYVLQTVSPQKDDPMAERFFAKLQIGKVQPGNGETQPIEPVEDTLPAPTPGSGIAAGRGGGIGSGSPSPAPDRQVETKPTSPLTILSRPRPLYTDLARFYGIQGAVRTRVVFLHDGTIGTVMPITKLPFGLTKSSVNAARSLQFQPALRDGKPYDVTKQVEYSFNLY